MNKLSTYTFLILSCFIFSCTSSKIKCTQHYKYSSSKIDITGLNVGIKKAGESIVDIGAGTLIIDPKYVVAKEKLQELDLLQFALCGQIKGIDKGQFKQEMQKKYVNTLLRMAEIAQNPEKVK